MGRPLTSGTAGLAVPVSLAEVSCEAGVESLDGVVPDEVVEGTLEVPAYLLLSASKSFRIARFCSRSLNCASCVTKVVPSIGLAGF